MNLKLNFRLYTRVYQQILENRLGIWTSRTGLIVQLEDLDTGRQGYGEIAPFPTCGAESYDQAFAFVNRLCYPIGKPHPPILTEETIAGIPPHLTATQFGFGCALAQVRSLGNEDEWTAPLPELEPGHQSALLQRGKFALDQWQPLWEQGYRTFKWKIGLGEEAMELKQLEDLLSALPSDAKLRLDANENLTLDQAKRWIAHCDPLRVEFLEQPLPTDQKDHLQALAAESPIPIALDESVSTLAELAEWSANWPGVFVIKVPLLGFPETARQFFREHSLDLVFSSVFETSIARRVALDFAQEFQNPKRSMGFGVQDWFDQTDGFENPDPSIIWQQIG